MWFLSWWTRNAKKISSYLNWGPKNRMLPKMMVGGLIGGNKSVKRTLWCIAMFYNVRAASCIYMCLKHLQICCQRKHYYNSCWVEGKPRSSFNSDQPKAIPLERFFANLSNKYVGLFFWKKKQQTIDNLWWNIYKRSKNYPTSIGSRGKDRLQMAFYLVRETFGIMFFNWTTIGDKMN